MGPRPGRSVAAALMVVLTTACASARRREPAEPARDATTVPGGPDLAAAVPDGVPPARDGAATSPDVADACPPRAIPGGLLALVDAVIAAMRARAGAGSRAFVPPTDAERDVFAATVTAALLGEGPARCALPAPYRLLRVDDPVGGVVDVVAEVDAAGAPAPMRFWGTFAALAEPAARPSRALAVEAPHPLFDTNTGRQAADLFVQTRARWLLVAGAHRCASDEPSGCSGTTGACGGVEGPFRVSDAAHSVRMPFAAVHAALSARLPPLGFLQLHGNAASACPDALVSDSSGSWPGSGPAAAIADALAATGVRVGRCHARDADALPTAACDLCGGANVQARQTAGSPDPCTRAGRSHGRFVHVEQHIGLRQTPAPGAPGYQVVIDAVRAAIPAISGPAPPPP